MRKFFKVSALLLTGIYLLYVVGILVLLNTPLFRQVANMSDDTLTHVDFQGAWSPFPGRLYVKELKIFILDSNVNIQVKVHDIAAWFDPRSLLQKEFDVTWLTGRGGTFVYVPKDAQKGADFHIRHSGVENQKPVTDEELRKRLESNFKIRVRQLVIDAESATFAGLELRGKEMQLRGGFFLQPDTVAEIFPSTLSVRDANFSEGVTRINVAAQAQFHRFWLRDASGNKVFRFLDFDAQGEAIATNFQALNVTLRSLPGYRFRRLGGNIAFGLHARRGIIQPGTFLVVDPSEVEFESPEVELAGKGRIRFEVPAGANYAELSGDVRAVMAKVKAGDAARISARAPLFRARARIAGLDLVEPFVGLRARADLVRTLVSARVIPPRKRKPTPQWNARALVNGSLALVTGQPPVATPFYANPKLGLRIAIQKADFAAATVPLQFDAHGTLHTNLEPIDLRSGRVRFSDFTLNLSIGTRQLDRFQVLFTAQDISRILPSPGRDDGNWRGKSHLAVNGFGTLLTELKDAAKLSDLMVSLLGTRHLKSDLEWEITARNAWVRTPRIETDGIWSAWGTLIHDFRKGTPEMALEGTILSVFPLGIMQKEGKTSFTLFPGSGWFDARR